MSDKIKNIIVTITFMSIILIILISNLIKEDTLISTSERRKLATFPKLSLSKIFDNSFSDEFEKYTMDQFIKRDEFRKIKTDVEFNILRKKDVNNLYEYNNIIIKQEYPLNETSILNISNKINEIKNTYLDETNNVYYSIVPDKNYFVDNEYLKIDYSKIEQIMSENLQDIEYINIFDCLKLEDYYYTDTHWKQENLIKVLEKVSTQMNFNDRIITDFDLKKVTDFKGVYSGQLQVDTKKDVINILTNNVIENSKVYNIETKKTTEIYDIEKLNGVDKYDIYLSGATPLLIIENSNASTEKELVVFRDSFGSSLIPLFTEAYKTITVVDTRYISPKYLKDYAEFSNKDVLFIYSTLVINNSVSLK